MDVTPLVKEGQQIIQSYTDGVFLISGKQHENSVIVTPDGTQKWDAQKSITKLTENDFDQLIAYVADYDVFLLGTGKTMEFLPVDLKNDLRGKGLSFDVMDTGAASRTYNVLMAEGRRVVAVMLPG